jgi:hypothetical protein
LPRLSLLLLQLLVDVQDDRARCVLVGYLLKRLDQTQHLQIFDAIRHGQRPPLRKPGKRTIGKIINGSHRVGTWKFGAG